MRKTRLNTQISQQNRKGDLMAARGAVSKEIITKLILKMFPESFSPDGKELRIPVMENGEEIQIKIALTAAKTNIERDSSGAVVPKEQLPASTGDVVKCGPLTDADKIAIIKQLTGIIDVELEPLIKSTEVQSNEDIKDEDLPF